MIKTVYQKYIKTSAREGYAPPVWKRAQVQGLKESRLIIRGDKDRGLVSSEELVRVQCVSKDMYKAVKGPITRPIVLSMVKKKDCRDAGLLCACGRSDLKLYWVCL